MREQAVPILVVSRHEDDAEAVSRHLRNAGEAAHCTWVADPGSLSHAVPRSRPELLFVFDTPTGESTRACVEFRNGELDDMPVVVVSEPVTEAAIAAGIRAGASDLASLAEAERFQCVALRELTACRTTRALAAARHAAEDYQRRVETMVSQSVYALIFAQEGIINSMNPACVELFGYADEDDLIGTPVMDLFDPDSQAVVKGALIACAQDKWGGAPLRAQIACSDGSSLPVETSLDPDTFDGEPCVRIALNPSSAREKALEAKLAASSIGDDPLAGFFYRRRFVDKIEARLAEEPTAGVTALAYVHPDGAASRREHLGPVRSEMLMLEFARLLLELVSPNDLAGRLEDSSFVVLLDRGNRRDVKAWANHVRAKTAQRVFEIGSESMALTCSIGLAVFDRTKDTLESLFSAAAEQGSAARVKGGDSVRLRTLEDTEADKRVDDSSAVVAINSALRSNGFRLVYQPMASMEGLPRKMFDVLVRMLDPVNGKEILPGRFLPAAARNGLMKPIDRWVLANAISVGAAAEEGPTHLFVRLSKDSIPDETLITWLSQQLSRAGVSPGRLVVQVTELHAENNLNEATLLVERLQKLGCGFALEHFGIGARPLQLLEHIQANFVKIDGSLMQSLATDAEMQERVGFLVEAARAKGMETIAERVEDANTMAVLYQAGVQFIQGFYVQAPEDIVF